MALVVFTLITYLFFMPQYQGQSLRQSDMVQYWGMGKDVNDHRAQYDEDPQWTGNAFSGMPSYMIEMDYPGRLVKQVTDNVYFMGQPAAYIFLAMAGFYLMLLMFGVSPWLAILGGVGYGLSTYFPIIIGAGHVTKMMALCWVAPLIGSIYYAYRRNRYLGALLAGIFAAIEISCSHPQITYYFLFAIVGLVIVEVVRAYRERIWRGFLGTTACLILAAVLAVGANLVQLYYVNSYTGESTRGPSELTATSSSNATGGLDKDYATAWSYGKGETFNLFIPNLLGGGSHSGFQKDGPVAESLKQYNAQSLATQLPGYWGDQSFTEGPVYLGAVMVFLFVLGLFVVRGAMRWWMAGVTALALMLAWGHNMMWFSDLFLDYFPMYNKFRSVSMILVLVQWAVPLLGVLGVNEILRGRVEPARVNRALLWSLGITGGFALFAAFILPNFVSFSSVSDSMMKLPEDVISAMQVERASMLRSDALRSFLFVVLAGAAIWVYVGGYIKQGVMVGALVVFTTVDLYNVDKRYLPDSRYHPVLTAKTMTPTANDQQILQDTTSYRVANFSVNPFTDASTSYFHRSVGGYHAAKLRRYQDLIDAHLVKQNMAVYDMLNTKYIITDKGVVENPGALGDAWFVGNVVFVEDANEEISALGWPDWQPQSMAFVDKRFREMIQGHIQGQNLAQGTRGEDLAQNAQNAQNQATPDQDIRNDSASQDAQNQGQASQDQDLQSASSAQDAKAQSIDAQTQSAQSKGAEQNTHVQSLSDQSQFSGLSFTVDSLSSIALTNYKVNHLSYKSSAQQPQIAIFSEIYYDKGWKAYIDGVESPYFRADYVLRGMVIPAGEHTIEWRFAAPHFALMVGLTTACSLVLLLGALAMIIYKIFISLRKNKTAVV